MNLSVTEKGLLCITHSVAARPTEEAVASSKDSGSSSMTRFCSQILHFDMARQGRGPLKVTSSTGSLLFGFDSVVIEVDRAKICEAKNFSKSPA